MLDGRRNDELRGVDYLAGNKASSPGSSSRSRSTATTQAAAGMHASASRRACTNVGKKPASRPRTCGCSGQLSSWSNAAGAGAMRAHSRTRSGVTGKPWLMRCANCYQPKSKAEQRLVRTAPCNACRTACRSGRCDTIRPYESPIYRAFPSGAYRDRTGDLRLAKPALSQLS